MNKTFTINGKEYKAKAFDFNLICDFEDMGISLADIGNKPMSVIRAYFGLCTGKGRDYAGKEMEGHIIAGGSFDELMQAMSDAMEESDFFRNLTENNAEKNTKNQSKTRAKA